jgi:hypothetical protein
MKTSSTAAAPARRQVDALDLLAREHAAIKRLFRDYTQLLTQAPDHERKADAVCGMCCALSSCLQIEDELFYPAARAALGNCVLMDHALLDHGTGQRLIAELDEMEPADDGFDAAVSQLTAYVVLHMQKVQDDVFPKVLLAGLDTAALGRQIAARQRSLKSDVTLTGVARPTRASHPAGQLAAM